MDIERTPLDLDTPEATREYERKLDMADDGKKGIVIELTIDGQSAASRVFRAVEIAHIDWNPIVNALAEQISEGV